MNKKWYPFMIGIAAVILLLLLLTDYQSKNRNEYDDHAWPSTLPDSARVGELKRAEDSVQVKEKWRKSQIRVMAPGGESTYAGPWGIMSTPQCDTCYSPFSYSTANPEMKYYFILPGYFYAKDEPVNSFFAQHNYYVGSRGLRFSINTEDPEEPGSILIPIKKGTYNVLNIGITILFICFCLWALFVITRPVIVLMNIAQGNAFVSWNYRALRFTGWSLVAAGLLLPFLSLLMNWIYRTEIPVDLEYPFLDHLFKNRRLVIAGLAVLLLAHAFKKGSDLREDQKLTV